MNEETIDALLMPLAIFFMFIACVKHTYIYIQCTISISILLFFIPFFIHICAGFIYKEILILESTTTKKMYWYFMLIMFYYP